MTGRRSGPTLSEDTFREAAQRHLARFPTTRKHLKEVLERRVRRARDRGEEVPALVHEWIESALDTMERAGLLNDQLFTELRIASLRRSGASARAIQSKLRKQGVDVAMLDAWRQEQHDEDDLAAARRYARRRRLGPYRNPPVADTARHDKDLAALARAGFSYHVARTVLTETDEAFP